MNTFQPSDLFGFAVVLGSFISPIGTFFDVQAKEKKLVGIITAQLLALSGREMVEQAPQYLKNRSHYHRRSLIIGFLVSLVCLGLGIWAQPENSRDLVFLLLIGPAALGLLTFRFNSTLKPSLARGISERIMKEGRFAQVDGWLQAFPACKWQGIGLLWEELLIAWGSWKAYKLTKDEKVGMSLHRKTDGLVNTAVEWIGYFKELRQDLISVEGMDIYALEAIGGKYTFWSELLKNFEVDGTLEMLAEMEDTEGGAKKELLESLSLQRDYLKALPHLFCPRCHSRGELLELQYIRAIHCECESAEGLITGIEKVVGMIGNLHPRGVKGAVFYLPVWDEEQRKATTGEIDEIVVARDFDGNLDWAIASLLEAQENRYSELELSYTLKLPKEAVLQPNTIRMLEEYPRLEIERY